MKMSLEHIPFVNVPSVNVYEKRVTITVLSRLVQYLMEVSILLLLSL